MEFTLDAVLALSPDGASAKAAWGLTSAGKWSTLGVNEQAVWGECQGSGSKPYQTQVDLTGAAGPAFRCSCPSRKFPCKHGLALLMVRCNSPAAFAAGEAPAWVSEWLVSRGEKAGKQSLQKAGTLASALTAEPDAMAKRQASEARRWQTIQAGLDHLQRWMADHIERGLATLGQEQRPGFHTTAARLVDAQAPGLAQRLKEAGDAIGTQPGWPARVLQCFGSLQWAADAVAQRATLPAPVLADLKANLGWPMDKAEVLATGVLLEDHFTVLAIASQPREAKVTERRVWLQGQQSGQRALLLDFSHAHSGSAGLEGLWVVGRIYSLALRYYPSASPLRAVIAGQADAVAGTSANISTGEGLTRTQANPDEWLVLARRLAANPWLPLAPMIFENATPVWHNGTWQLHLQARQGEPVTAIALRIGDEPGWLLAAHSGGHSLTLFGEWDGTQLTPLTAWGPGGTWLNARLT